MNPFHDISIGGILPQREPFVFVDRLEHYDDVETVTSFTVREGHLMVQDGVLSAPGILENMAQSSAARIGYLCKYILHVPVRIGYIGAIRKLQVHRLSRLILFLPGKPGRRSWSSYPENVRTGLRS